MKTAFITGITGMDGYYLSNFLIKNGYEIHGLIRATSSIEHLDKRIHFHIGDWTSLQILFELILPNEIYHLAAQSNVGTSFQNPKLSVETDIEGIVYILEAIKKSGLISSVKLFNACSSEMYAGTDRNVLITENTLMSPQSPYALAKQFSFSMVKLYRDVYGLFGCNGILFNHTGPLRRNNFVCKKITSSIKKISEGKLDCLKIGNLDTRRDFGYAPDYTNAMWKMLQYKVAKDYVIASGKLHSLREMIEIGFEWVGISIIWKGTGKEEIGICENTGKILVCIDPEFYRPNDVGPLCGDSSLAKSLLNWETSISFYDMIGEMVLL